MAKAYVAERSYEAVYVVNPNYDEDKLNAMKEKFQELVKSFDAEGIETELWEKRRLAYEVKGFREGWYLIMKFSGKNNVSNELERAFRLNEDVLRFIVVRLDEK